MRTPLVAWRLAFPLPPALWLLAPPGRHSPCLHGCVLIIGPGGQVAIEGPSRERVFDQAQRFLRVITKGMPPRSIPAYLQAPCGRRDGWSIIVRADIAIVPTAMEGSLYAAEPLERSAACAAAG